jgi:hypothetical protein
MAAATTTANKVAAEQAQATAEQVNAERVKAKTNAEVKANSEQTTTDRAPQEALERNAEMSEEAIQRFEENFEQNAERVTKMAEQNSQRVTAFSSAMMDSSKAGSRVAVDTYAKAAKSLFAMQRQLAGITQIQWVKDAANTQIQFAEDITDAWAKAAHQLLK